MADGEQRSRRSLRELREAIPLSQDELADRARLSRSTIAALESGKRRPQPQTMRLLAETLKVKVWDIAW
jgi:transcriptional regulator with XRE-family HTH domain